jgi:hypothetical protein
MCIPAVTRLSVSAFVNYAGRNCGHLAIPKRLHNKAFGDTAHLVDGGQLTGKTAVALRLLIYGTTKNLRVSCPIL